MHDRFARTGDAAWAIHFGMAGQLRGGMFDSCTKPLGCGRVALNDIADDRNEVGAGLSAPDERPHGPSHR